MCPQNTALHGGCCLCSLPSLQQGRAFPKDTSHRSEQLQDLGEQLLTPQLLSLEHNAFGKPGQAVHAEAEAELCLEQSLAVVNTRW